MSIDDAVNGSTNAFNCSSSEKSSDVDFKCCDFLEIVPSHFIAATQCESEVTANLWQVIKIFDQDLSVHRHQLSKKSQYVCLHVTQHGFGRSHLIHDANGCGSWGFGVTGIKFDETLVFADFEVRIESYICFFY